MSEEFRIMGFRELEKFYEENGYDGGVVWTCFRTITNHKSQTIR